MKQTLAVKSRKVRFASFKAEMDAMLAQCFSDSWDGYVDECARLLHLSFDLDDENTVFLALSEQNDNLITWTMEELVSNYIETFVEGELNLTEQRACLKMAKELETQSNRVREALKRSINGKKKGNVL